MNFEDLFDECAKDQKYAEPKNMINVSVEKLMTEIESEYRGIGTTFSDRKKEKEDLKNKIEAAEIKLKNIKNPKNFAKMPFTKREALNKKLHDSREELRKEIKICKVRLDEIKIEEGDQEKQGPEKDVENNTRPEQNSNNNNKWNMNPYSEFL
jgi:chromosome segregation ATPase